MRTLALLAVIFTLTISSASPAQIGSLPEFDVASVRQNKIGGETDSNYPLAPGNAESSVPDQESFHAQNMPLIYFISFAYQISSSQLTSLMSQLPAWAKNDRFDIQARANKPSTKAGMRLMMRSLLADRFKLKLHTETEQMPAFALETAQMGKTGSRLQPHPKNSTCSKEEDSEPAPATKSSTISIGHFPDTFPCGRISGIPPTSLGNFHVGGRNVTMGLLAGMFSAMGQLGRPVVDRTGLSGTYDFELEWLPERPGNPASPGNEPSGPEFVQAVKEQLGLKLNSTKAPVEVITIDHVEYPSSN